MTLEVRNLLSSNSGHVWSWVQELNSEKTKPSGHPYASTSQAKGTPSAGGYFISGKCQDGRRISRGIPTTISPIAATTRSGSVTPPADTAELWGNANKALEEWLAIKASIDTCRHRAVWELGIELHQNESEVTKSIREARAICSQVTLDAKALCFAVVKEAKAIWACVTPDTKAQCFVTVKEAKTT